MTDVQKHEKKNETSCRFKMFTTAIPKYANVDDYIGAKTNLNNISSKVVQYCNKMIGAKTNYFDAASHRASRFANGQAVLVSDVAAYHCCFQVDNCSRAICQMKNSSTKHVTSHITLTASAKFNGVQLGITKFTFAKSADSSGDLDRQDFTPGAVDTGVGAPCRWKRVAAV